MPLICASQIKSVTKPAAFFNRGEKAESEFLRARNTAFFFLFVSFFLPKDIIVPVKVCLDGCQLKLLPCSSSFWLLAGLHKERQNHGKWRNISVLINRTGGWRAVGIVINCQEQHGKSRHLGLGGWCAGRPKENYLLFCREFRLEELRGVSLLIFKVRTIPHALFIGCRVSCFPSECWRKALHTRHLCWDKLRGLIKLGLEGIEGRGEASLKSSMLRSASIFIFVADQNSSSFKSCLQHLFLAGSQGWAICLMPHRQ